jgi:hypothetical protein
VNAVTNRINVLANRSLMTSLGLEAERLNVLDDLWTGYLAEPHSHVELGADLSALQPIVGEMMFLLSSMFTKSFDLQQLIREFPSDLDHEFELLTEKHPARAWLLEHRPPQPLAQTVVDACTVLQQETPGAMVELSEKLARLAEGRFEPGDFRLTLKCAITAIGVGALVLAACAGPGALIVLPAAVVAGAGIGGAVVTGVAALTGWNCARPTPAPATP